MVGMSEKILGDLFRTAFSKENESTFTHVKFGHTGSKLRQENNKWRAMRAKKV
jgi:hypothetical protein